MGGRDYIVLSQSIKDGGKIADRKLMEQFPDDIFFLNFKIEFISTDVD